MAIYDNNGTSNAELGTVYDNNGTTSSQIGKVYDNNGTTDSLIYNSELILFGNGVLYGTWEAAYQGGTMTSTGWTATADNSHRGRYCTTKIDFSQYSTIEVTTSQITKVNNRTGYFKFGVASSIGTYGPNYTKNYSYTLGTLAAGTYKLDISSVTDTAYFAMNFDTSGTGTVYSAKLY